MKNKTILILILLALILILIGCGTNDIGTMEGKEVGFKANKSEPIKVAIVSGSTSGDVFNIAEKILKKEGYTVETTVLTDYNAPNAAVADGTVDFNFYQHQPFLDAYNNSNGTDLKSISPGVYNMVFVLVPGQAKNLDEIEEGMTVAIPNDASNRKIILNLMQNANLIKVDDSVELPTPADIIENPYNFEFVEVEETMVPGVVEDVGFGGMSGSRWVASGGDISEVIYSKPIPSSTVLLVTRAGNEDSELAKVLQDALCSKEVAEYLNSLGGAVSPVFDY